jgi:hypothetical protein
VEGAKEGMRTYLQDVDSSKKRLQTGPVSAAPSTGGCVVTSIGSYIKRKTSQPLDAVSSGSRIPEAVVTPELVALIYACR